jgi:Na+/proline symporter
MMVQRYLCSPSLGQARLALVLSGLVIFAQFLLFLLIGVGLYVLAELGILVVPSGTRDDAVFGQFIVTFLPHGVIGLVVAAVLAAAMSTLSSSLNSSATAFVVDFYRPLRPGQGEGHYLRVSKLMTAFFGLVQVGVALFTHAAGSDRSIVGQVLTVAGITTGLVLGLFLLGRLPWRVGSRSALVGLLAGFAAVCLVWRPWLPRGELLAWPWYAPVGALTTVAVALLLDLGRHSGGSPGDGGAEPGVGTPR